MKKSNNMISRMVSARYHEWLISLIGASIIAFALGVLFTATFTPYVPILLIVGIVMHGWAMYVIHQRNG
jgi:hypothetical protein